MNIFVGNLSFKTTEQELQREFDAFGEVVSVKIIMDRDTGKSRGFAFVEMRDRDQAMAAIAGINGKELAGQTLKVNEAKPREARGGPRGERTGGRSGSGGGGGGNRDRSRSAYQSKEGDANIYDSKGRSGGGYGRRDRTGRGPGSGGRSGGGRRSH